jgi:hypothetical protein
MRAARRHVAGAMASSVPDAVHITVNYLTYRAWQAQISAAVHGIIERSVW